MDSVFSGGPKRKYGRNTSNGAFFVADMYHEAVGVCDEVHVAEDAAGGPAFDGTMPMIDLIENHLLMTAEKLAH